jgi:drug/metabolite transporter (DMT)-like permease
MIAAMRKPAPMPQPQEGEAAAGGPAGGPAGPGKAPAKDIGAGKTAAGPAGSLAFDADAGSTAAGPRQDLGQRPGLRVHAALVVAQLCFGGFHVVGKAVLAELPPLVLAAIRAGLAAPLLVWLAWRHDRRLPARRDLPWLALLAALGVFGNQVLFVFGLQRTTAINASILMPSMPVFAVLAAALLGIERIGARRLVGVALSVAGALVLANPFRLLAVGGAGAPAPRSVALGNAMLILNCICWAFFLVLQRPILRRLPWRTVIAWSFVIGAVPVLALAAPQLAALRWEKVSPLAWWGVAYVVLFATVIAYAISTWAVRRSSPALVAAYSTLQPVVATALAASFLGERLGWAEAAGFALIATGLWRISAAPPASPRSPARQAPGSPGS